MRCVGGFYEIHSHKQRDGVTITPSLLDMIETSKFLLRATAEGDIEGDDGFSCIVHVHG